MGVRRDQNNTLAYGCQRLSTSYWYIWLLELPKIILLHMCVRGDQNNNAAYEC